MHGANAKKNDASSLVGARAKHASMHSQVDACINMIVSEFVCLKDNDFSALIKILEEFLHQVVSF